MARTKLTLAQIQQLREEYEAWTPFAPGAPSATELARKYGISRQTLYNLRRKWLADDQRTQRENVAEKERNYQSTIEFLAGELAKARAQVEVLRDELDRLRTRLG